MDITPNGLAYIAGLIDGEGTCTISKKNLRGGGLTYQQKVLIANSHVGLLEAIKTITGRGIVYIQPGARANWNIMGRWQATGGDARAVLEAVLPFLVIKRDVARAVLTFPLMPPTMKFVERPAFKAVQAERLGEIHAMNARGVHLDPERLRIVPELHASYHRHSGD